MENQAKSDAAQPQDVRYFPRWEVKNRVLFQLEDDLETLEAHTTDISCAGAQICVPKSLTLDQKVKLVIYLSKTDYISVNGKVVWVKNLDGTNHLGIQFYNTPNNVQDLILKYAFELNHNDLRSQFFKGWEKKPKS